MADQIAPVAPVAPAAPAPKPAAAASAPSPAPSPAPSAPIVRDTKEHDGWADLDAKFKAEGGEPVAKTEPEPAKKPEAAPAAAPVSSPKPAAEAPKPSKEPKELREELERTRGELTTIKSSIPTLEAKIKEYEARGQDTEALTKRLEQLEKNLSDKEGEIRALRQETSPDFKEKWDKPFHQQADYARAQLEGLLKQDGTPFTWGDDTGKGDFAELYGMPYSAARAKATEMLGPEGAQTVMDEIRDLKKLDFSRNQALKEERANWKKKEEIEAGQRVQRQEQIKQLQSKVRKELQDSVEDYRDSLEDKEATTARQEGYQLFDTKPKTLQEAILKDEHVRHRVAAHAPMKLQIARLKSELAKRDETIAKMKPKVPGENGGRNPGGEVKTDAEPEAWEDYLKKNVDA